MPEVTTIDAVTDSRGGPPPIEFLMRGLAGCLTAGIATIAAARGVTLTVLESQVDNGSQRVHINVTIAGDAPPEQLRQLVEQSRLRSAVYDMLIKTVPVDVTVTTRQPGARAGGAQR